VPAYRFGNRFLKRMKARSIVFSFTSWPTPEYKPINRIRCGNGSLQPIVAVCAHVLLGAPVATCRLPDPGPDGEWGEAMCVDCADRPLGAKGGLENIRLICWPCFDSQFRPKVVKPS